MSTDVNTELALVSQQFPKVRIIESLQWEAEKQHALAIISQSQQLQEADPQSLATSLLQAASMGLSLNPALGYCYIIPRRARKKRQNENWDKYKNDVPIIAYASPSYKGLSEICIRGGRVEWLRAEVVYKADKFVYRGPVEKPEHIPTITQKDRTEALATGVYAIAKIGNDCLTEYVDRDTILRIRGMSDNSNGIMWDPKRLWTEGWKKAAIRRLTKTLPKSPGLEHAIEVMNTHETIDVDAGEEISDEQYVCISEQDIGLLRKLLHDHSITEAQNQDKWLSHLATRFGADVIGDLPASKTDEAYDFLKGHLEARKEGKKT